MSQRYEGHAAYVRAFNDAATRATAANIEMVIRRVKEFGRDGFNVSMACKTDADYWNGEIVRPGQPLMTVVLSGETTAKTKIRVAKDGAK